MEEATPTRRRADALGLLAESALAATLDPGTAGDRYQVVVHVDPETLREDVSAETPVPRWPERRKRFRGNAGGGRRA